MADRIPLIVNPDASQIQELPTADNLVLSGQLKLTGTTTTGVSDVLLSGGSDGTAVITVTENNGSNVSKLVIDGKGNGGGSGVNGAGKIAEFIMTGTTPSLSVTLPSGRTPIVSNTPAFRATLGADQMLSNYTRTAVAFGAEDFDSDNRYNASGTASGGIEPYSFLPNVAGFYYIFASTSIDCNQDKLGFARVQICKNGLDNVMAACVSGVDGGYSLGTGERFKEATQTASIILEMNGTSDYITISSDATHNGASGATINLRCPPTVRSYVHAYKLIM